MPTKEQAGGGAASLNDASRTVLSVREAFKSCDINQCCYCDSETSDTVIHLHFPPSVSLSLGLLFTLYSLRARIHVRGRCSIGVTYVHVFKFVSAILIIMQICYFLVLHAGRG